MEAFMLIESTINETSTLSNSLDQFCMKYKLPREMSNFEKEDYKQKIEELKIKFGN